MKTVFVFGGSGFIGTNLINSLLKKNIRVINIDKLSYASVPEKFKEYTLNKNYLFFKIDLLNKRLVEKILTRFKPSYIYNLAAMSHVDRSIDKPINTVENNILSTLVLADCLRIHIKKYKQFKKLIHISTDEVYGDVNKKTKETEKLSPSSPYSSSKSSCDLILKSYFRTYKLPIIILRPCNNYGPFQFPEKFIPTIILNILSRKKIPIYGNGLQMREWIFVKDLARLMIKFMKVGKIGNIYNLGSGHRVSNKDLVLKIFNILKDVYSLPEFKKIIKEVKDRPGHDKSYSLNYNKARKIINDYKIGSFNKNIKETIFWYIKNSSWIKHTNNKYKGERLGLKK